MGSSTSKSCTVRLLWKSIETPAFAIENSTKVGHFHQNLRLLAVNPDFVISLGRFWTDFEVSSGRHRGARHAVSGFMRRYVHRQHNGII